MGHGDYNYYSLEGDSGSEESSEEEEEEGSSSEEEEGETSEEVDIHQSLYCLAL